MNALRAQGSPSSVKTMYMKRLRCIYRLSAIGLTNMAIFASMTVINIHSMFGRKTNEIEVVTALLLFPLNAILNPLFNTLLCEDFYIPILELVGFHA